MSAIVESATAEGRGMGWRPTVSAPSSQVTSAGRIKVATCPGGPMAAATAAATSSPTVAGSVEEWTQPDTPLAIAAMSDCSGASYFA